MHSKCTPLLAALGLAVACLACSPGCSMNEACQTDSQDACEPFNDPPCETACEEPKKPCKVCTPECCNPRADIEALKAVNVPCTLDLAIGYKVDTECTCDDFDLQVHVEHCGKILFERLIPLRHPYRIDADGDRHYRGSTYGKLPEIICANRDTFKIVGWVIPHSASGDKSAMIDREHERVHGSNDWLWLSQVPKGWPEYKIP
jgi:hypothetical protein